MDVTKMMNLLDALLSQITLRAGVFYTGNICGIHKFPEDSRHGHLHLVKHGVIRVKGVGVKTVKITEPVLLFLPRPGLHQLVADNDPGADVICGTVQFDGGNHNPVVDSIPDVVLVKLKELPGITTLSEIMFEEASSERVGRQAILDRLCEILIIRLLQYCLDNGLTQGGTLAGLADRRLSRVLAAIHEDPASNWNLERLAAIAGMSRARFAVHFREITGETPASYLASWRVMAAQRLLRQGFHPKHVAYDVGYGSASALTKVFMRKLGCSPFGWLKTQKGG